MKRVFQHYKGEIEDLKGLRIQGLLCLYHNEGSNEGVILIWLESIENKWFRIFIDNSYCGVDKYDTNHSESDLDDGIAFKNYDSRVNGLTIESAIVITDHHQNIELGFRLHNGSRFTLEGDKEGQCKLRFFNSSEFDQ